MAINHWVVYFFLLTLSWLWWLFLGHQVICFNDFSDCQLELFLSESAYFVKTPCFLDTFWQCWCVFSITLTLVDWMDVMVCTKTVPRASRGGNTNVADTDEPPTQVGYSKTFFKVILTRSRQCSAMPQLKESFRLGIIRWYAIQRIMKKT